MQHRGGGYGKRHPKLAFLTLVAFAEPEVSPAVGDSW